jgi:hypothetical protein
MITLFLSSLFSYIGIIYEYKWKQKDYLPEKENLILVPAVGFWQPVYLLESVGKRRLKRAEISPFGSIHDQVYELYYSILGGETDYTGHHSVHGRFGTTYPGLFKDWSNKNKVVLISYSTSVFVCDAFLELVRKGRFKDRQGNVLTEDSLEVVRLGCSVESFPKMNWIRRVFLWLLFCVGFIRLPQLEGHFPFLFSNDNIFHDLELVKPSFKLKKQNIPFHFENFFWWLFSWKLENLFCVQDISK